MDCILIVMVIPSERNISIKVTEKLSKYKDLDIEINRVWGTKKNTNKIPKNISIRKVQKISLLRTAHKLQRVLSYK